MNFSGACNSYAPTELHDIKLSCYNILEKEKSISQQNKINRKLPVLALNEV